MKMLSKKNNLLCLLQPQSLSIHLVDKEDRDKSCRTVEQPAQMNAQQMNINEQDKETVEEPSQMNIPSR